MHQEFLDLYDRELKLLLEQAKEFGEEFPGIAERLGGLAHDRMDPMVGGLLEGAAFLAARVQLKMQHEFPEFINNLLEQLIPSYLAPTPSSLLVGIRPPFPDPALREGITIARGSYLDATYRERERRVSCRFRLTAPVTLWPFEIVDAAYLPAPAAIQALRVPVDRRGVAALKLTLTHRSSPDPETEVSDIEARKQPGLWFAGCRTRDLTVHLTSKEDVAIALCEQVFSDCVGVYFRHLDEFGDPVITPAPADCLRQIGFAEDDALLPNDMRIFRGFHLLREHFWFPRKFLGFRLAGLKSVMPHLKAKTVDIILVFDEVNPRLQAAVDTSGFALYSAPAINLFEKNSDRVPVKVNQYEYQVIPDRSRPLDYEPHHLLEVYAHYTAGREKETVQPLYSAPHGATTRGTLYYTHRRLPRRRSSEERRFGRSSDYTGTEIYLSLLEPARVEDERGVAELSVRSLCSNRHLTEHLPVGEGGADFRLIDHVTLDCRCLAGPTPPREPIVGQLRSRTEVAGTGTVAWRLLSFLGLAHHGLVERGADRGAQALTELLGLFADLTDPATDRKLRGIRALESRPIVRRFRQRTGIGAARGIEITVTFDEKSFEGSGVFLLGAVLDRFFPEYAAMNHFTQTVIRTAERGEIVRFPPRAGSRRAL